MTCTLYRHFDASGQLLYVGISKSPLKRLSQHEALSDWASQIASVTFEEHATREDAQAAERKAIAAEKPLYNVNHVAPVAAPREQGAFRRAFVAAMEASGASVSSIAAASGVSRDVINKLIARPGSTTSAENAVALAEYFGKTLNDLMEVKKPAQIDIDLIAAIEKCCEENGFHPTMFGRLAINDANLLTQLRDGRELRKKTRAKIIAFISKQANP